MDVENKYGTLEMQKALLILLKRFDKVCLDNGISYSLAYGTLLGAVRHNGFIPWDDDADVIMNRNNFERFRKVSFEGTGCTRSRLLWLERLTLDGCQIDDRKPTIDIFIFDNLPNSVIARKWQLLKIKFLQGIMKSKPKYSVYPLPLKFVSFFLYLLGLLFSEEAKLNWYHRNASKYSRVSTAMTGGGSFFFIYRYLDTVFDGHVMDKIERHEFEDTTLSVVSNYDSMLTTMYGDYMTPPRESERRPKHI